jgi:hypothetical protein
VLVSFFYVAKSTYLPKAPDSIVFVHGLYGDQAPWTSEADVFWPDKILPAKISDACILSFEYEAALGSFFDEDDEITDISNELINELMDHRTEKEKVGLARPRSTYSSSAS